MNEMSSLEDLLLGENYLARCQQLVNLITLLTNGQLQNTQQANQQQPPQSRSPLALDATNQPMPNSVLQILQHLQDNQDLQQCQREQYRLHNQQLQLQQQQTLIQQQQQHSDQLFQGNTQQQPSIAQQNQLQSRLCDPAQVVTVSRHYHNHHQYQHHHHQAANGNNNNNTNNNGSSLPSSTLLAKLTAITSRPSAQFISTKLDQTMIDFLEAIYAINDNPEPAAIEMLSKRLNTTSDAISDWFDETRLKLNPTAGPRSPPAKKRQGGRVVTFSEYQRSLLEAIFDENNYLHPQEYEELSNLIQVPSRNIKIWFKNRRSKQRLSGRVESSILSSSSSSM